jgi:hypothetical protein
MRNNDTYVRASGWHFLRKDWTSPNDPDEVYRVGQTAVHRGGLQIGKSGLHASSRAIEALRFATGTVVTRVMCYIEEEEDGTQKAPVMEDYQMVGNRRKIVWGYDAEEELRTFARHCANSVVHLWVAPDVVKAYLRGDSTNKEAAETATREMLRGMDGKNYHPLSAVLNAGHPKAHLAAEQTAMNAMRAMQENMLNDLRPVLPAAEAREISTIAYRATERTLNDTLTQLLGEGFEARK